MKKYLAIVLGVVISTALLTRAAEREIKLYNGDTMSESIYNEMVHAIHNYATALGDEAYRKYSDGSICYLGRVMCISQGILPNTITNGVTLVDDGYKVEDVTDDGCRITILPPKHSEYVSRRDVFVRGLVGFSDRQYKKTLMLRLEGSYTYETVRGGSRTIPKYEMGEKSSKVEYDAFMSGKLKPKPKAEDPQPAPKKSGIRKNEI